MKTKQTTRRPTGGDLRTRPKQKRGNPNWRKGGPSPNPGGRPKTRQFSEAARNWFAAEHERAPHMSNAEALVEFLGNEAFGGEVAAARALIEYAEGKPKQSIDLNVEETKREWAEGQLERVMEKLNLQREEAVEWMRANTPTAAQWIN
jgi:hypothetical protein